MNGFCKAKRNEMDEVINGAQGAMFSQAQPTKAPKDYHRWSINIPNECRNHFMLYKFLKKNFGDPSYSMIPKINGKYTNIHYKKYGTERQQWEYDIRTPSGYIAIYDKERTYIIFHGYTELKENDKSYNNRGMSDITPIDIETDKRVPTGFKEDLKIFFGELISYCLKFNHNKKINQGFIIPNPHQIHFENYKYHLKLLTKTYSILQKTNYPNDLQILSDARNLGSSAFILLMASFEGFIESIYTIFIKDEVEHRLDKYITNQKLETKIKLLPIFCNEFREFKENFFKSKEYSNFNELMRIRNRLLHGNIWDTRVTHIIEEDGFLFYLGDDVKDFPFYGYSSRDFKIETEKFLNNAENTVNVLIRDIISMVQPKKRKYIKNILNEEWIGCVQTKNGIEFVTEQIW